MKTYTTTQLGKELRKDKKFREYEDARRKINERFWRRVSKGVDRKTFMFHLGSYDLEVAGLNRK